tara:strand:+ start:1053 stop:1253 length:201 start_codon:yes stop_codon:yes gene_type:complete
MSITVGELKEALKYFNDDEGVIIWFKWKGDSVCDSVQSLARNGDAIQICGRTCYEDENGDIVGDVE